MPTRKLIDLLPSIYYIQGQVCMYKLRMIATENVLFTFSATDNHTQSSTQRSVSFTEFGRD